MEIKQFIEKAIEGGWDDTNYAFGSDKPNIDWKVASWEYDEKVFLDPLAWQAVGKVEEWQKINTPTATYCVTCQRRTIIQDEWKDKMRGMIDALIGGKSIEEYIKTL